MPTPTTQTDSDQPITSVKALADYFRAASKPQAAWRVGLQQEKIPVRDDGLPVPYEGPRGIAALMAALQQRGFVAEEVEDGHPIALGRQRERITLEPGGQLELSGPALVSAEAGRQVLVSHVREVQA